MIAESVLEDLGVRLAGGNDREIRGFCPVHHLVKGREQDSPKWYMNRATGAWLCFTCHQRGSLLTLAQMLGGDMELLQQLPVEVMKASVEQWAKEDDEDEEAETVFVSHYAFLKNPLPPKAVRKMRGLSKESCERYNMRWSTEGHCFLTPIYGFDAQFLGWQEKAKGYSNNFPEGVAKSKSLYGYQQVSGNSPIVMMESPLDAVYLASIGIRNPVATYGSFVSNAQLVAVAEATDDVILAFDHDDAGVEATIDVARRLNGIVRVRYFRYPLTWEGKDPGELSVGSVVEGIETASSFVRGDSYSQALSLRLPRRPKYGRGTRKHLRR